MMAVGEDTGALDTMLEKIADFYDQEVESTTEQLTSLIEPLMIVVLGVDHRRHGHRAVHADLRHLQPHQLSQLRRHIRARSFIVRRTGDRYGEGSRSALKERRSRR